MTSPSEMNRLRWQCRRGMLELDYLFQTFLEHHYAHLAPAIQQDFVRLLKCTDPFLYDWLLLGISAPEDPALQNLVALIRREMNHLAPLNALSI